MDCLLDFHVLGKAGLADLAVEDAEIVGCDLGVMTHNHSVLQPLSQALKVDESAAAFAEARGNDAIVLF